MARESCNRDKDEAEILKVPSSSSSPAPPQPPSAAASPPSMFLKHPQDYPIQRSERSEMLAVDPDVTFSSHAQKQGREESSHPQPVPEISTSNSGVPSCSRKRKHEEEGHQPPVPLINRCLSCQKRVGLMGFRCRCGDLFCSRHRYSDAHDCSFDYKSAGREEIAKANPVIRAAKIIKI